MQVGERVVHRLEVLADDVLPLASIGFPDGLLDLVYGFLAGQDPRDGEEAGLHYRVDPHAHVVLASDLVGVDHEQADLLLQHLLLGREGKVVPDLRGGPGRIQQESGALCRVGQDVVLLHEYALVAAHECRLGDEAGLPDGFRSESQVAHRQGAGLLRVVYEVALRVVVGFLADDLDGVLVRADRSIGAEPQEHGLVDARGLEAEVAPNLERGACHIVGDPDCEVVDGLTLHGFVEHRCDHPGGELLAPEAVSSAERPDASPAGLRQRVDYVEVEGLAGGAGLLRAVEDCHGLHRQRKGG